MNRRINQVLSVLLSKKQNSKQSNNSLLLLLPMGLGDAMMFLDSFDYYFDNSEYSNIIIMSTRLAHKVFVYARPNLKYRFIEYNPMEMDTNFNVYLKYQRELGKIRYKTIVYPLRGFLTMDLLFSKLCADEKICIDTIKMGRKSNKVKFRDMLIKGNTILRFKSSDMDLIRYARVVSYVNKTEIKSKLPLIKTCIKRELNPYVQFSVGSSRPEKCWPSDRYIDVIKYILENTECDVVFTGAESDSKTVDGIINKFSDAGRLSNLCGKTSLEELFDIVGNAKLLIGPDSGPIHVAVAMNTPSICIVGGWDYERVYPYKTDILDDGRCAPVIVNTGVKYCYKCLLLYGHRGANNSECAKLIKESKPCLCIEDISSDNVIDELQKMMYILN